MFVRRLQYYYDFNRSKSRVSEAFSRFVQRESLVRCTGFSSGTSLVPISPNMVEWEIIPFDWNDISLIMSLCPLTKDQKPGE